MKTKNESATGRWIDCNKVRKKLLEMFKDIESKEDFERRKALSPKYKSLKPQN